MTKDVNYIHPSFPQPRNLDMPVWRYLDHNKFEWLITNKRLYMPCAKQFLDPLEGTAPQGDHNHRLNQIKQEKSPILNAITLENYYKIERFGNAFKDNYFVSCWHINNKLNPRMWNEYTNSSESVAIKSRYRVLVNCFPDARIGLVRYIDYDKDKLPTLNMFERIMHKDKKEFEWEQEVRAVFSPCFPSNVYNKQLYSNLIHSNPNGEQCFIPEINLGKLIHEIHFHPESTEKYRKTVTDMLKESEKFALTNGHWVNLEC